jgi:hypothetical protein
VALKVITPELVGDSVLVERFQREARAAGRLRHPHVVDVTDFGIAAGPSYDVAYLVMEFLEGETLAALLRKTPRLPLDTVVDLAKQICAAMEAAHRAGIVHRDLKPDNVWLTPREDGKLHVKVLDFGIAKLRERDAPLEPAPSETPNVLAFAPTEPSRAAAARSLVSAIAATLPAPAAVGALTEDGAFLGTPLYMSPEQCEGKPLDARTDVYSLGVMLYEMLAGAPPFTAASLPALLWAHVTATPPPLAEKRTDVPPAVASLVMAALEKDPDRRPSSCARLAVMLEARAEGAMSLLRRGLSIYVTHFGVLVRLAWPVVLFSLVMAMLELGFMVAPAAIREPLREPVQLLWHTLGGVLYVAAMGSIAECVVQSVGRRKAWSAPTLGELYRRSNAAFVPSIVYWGVFEIIGFQVFYKAISYVCMAVEAFRSAPSGSLASPWLWPGWGAPPHFGWGSFFVNWYLAYLLSFLVLRRWFPVPVVIWLEGGPLRQVARRATTLAKRDLGTLTRLLPPLTLMLFAPIWAAYICLAFFQGWPADVTIAFADARLRMAGTLIVATLMPPALVLVGTVLALLYLHLRHWEGETTEEDAGGAEGHSRR